MFLCSFVVRYSSIRLVTRYTVRVPNVEPKNTAQNVLFTISDIVLLRYIINYILYYRPLRGLIIYYININYTHRYQSMEVASDFHLTLHLCIIHLMSIQLEEYTLPEHISYSAFSTYLTCGYQYYLGRLLEKQEEPSVWSVGGSAFHLACETYDRDNL